MAEKVFSQYKWRAEQVLRNGVAYADMFNYPKLYHGYTIPQYAKAIGFDRREEIYFVDPSELSRRFDLEVKI